MRRIPVPVWFAGIPAALVVLAGMILSYNALAVLALSAGIDPMLSWAYPGVIDGVIITGSVAAYVLRRARLRIRLYLWSLIGVAVGLSIVGNATHALTHGGLMTLPPLAAAAVSAVPPASLAAALHVIVVLWRALGTAQSGITDAPRPRVVCLCGSTRFKDTFEEVARQETVAGRIVLTVNEFANDGHPEKAHLRPVGPDEKARLDELHLRKIDLADEVLILNVGGYIGESTGRELAYARELGKDVRFLEAGGPAVEVPETHALTAHEEAPNGRQIARRGARTAARTTRTSRARIEAMVRRAATRGQELDSRAAANRLGVTPAHARKLLAEARRVRATEEATS